MKVLRISQEYTPVISGPIKQASAITRELTRLGIKHTIIASNEGVPSRLITSEKLDDLTTVIRFPIQFKIMRFYYLKGLTHYMNQLEPDVIHIHGWRNHASDFALRMGKKRKIPVILHAHGMAYAEQLATTPISKLPYKLYDYLFKKQILEADAIVTSTWQEKKECIAYGFAEEKINVIPSGIDPEDYDSVQIDERRTSKKPNIIFVGRLSRDRNVELALKALNIVKQENIEFDFTIVGGEEKRTQTSQGGYLKELQVLTRQLKLDGHVHFKGQLKGPELIQALKQADIFLYTSRYENFGNTVLEAAAAKLPIIATKTGVANDLIKEGVNGYFVELNQPKQLANNLKAVLTNKELRISMGKASLKASQEYHWQNIALQYLSLYENLTSKKVISKK